jgi:hypothetical protein
MTEKARRLGEQPVNSSIELTRCSDDCPFDSKTEPGLTKREYFAGLALQISRPNDFPICDIAEEAVLLADALLEKLAQYR